MTPSSLISCEIFAPAAAHRSVLAEIAKACANDVGQPITIKRCQLQASRTRPQQPTVTLYLPAALAATQNQIWCLACRLACFCPSARVSVLILAVDAFSPATETTVEILQSA